MLDVDIWNWSKASTKYCQICSSVEFDKSCEAIQMDMLSYESNARYGPLAGEPLKEDKLLKNRDKQTHVL